MKTAIIIGSGLGGLQCGYILAKNGIKVTILEQNAAIGGCLQSFQREGITFDTGFHYVGGLREGESLHNLFKYFNLLALPWQQLDEECFDEVRIGQQSFPFASGHKLFVEKLSSFFPKEKDALQKYATFLQKVGNHLPGIFEDNIADEYSTYQLLQQSAYQFLRDCTKNHQLQKVLSGTSLKMELQADSLPLYIFAQINNSYLQSAWKLKGCSRQIVQHLASDIRRMGGEIRTKAEVVKLEGKNKMACAVELRNGERLEADLFISDVHPATTLNWLTDSCGIRKIYRKRIQSAANSFGMFTVHTQLKKNIIKYLNKNIYIHTEEAELWKPNTQQTESVMCSFYVPEEGDYASAIDLLTPMNWAEVAQWSALSASDSCADYAAFKQRKAEDCINLAALRLPELKNAIETTYTSSPLTYARYTGSGQGSAYGLRKDFKNVEATVLSPRTPLGNLFYTGQNLNFHGLLGVSITSLFTCSEILGIENIKQQIKI